MDTRLEQRTLRLSLGATLVVAGLGVGFGLLSGSQSILFDGVFSVIDGAMTVLSLVVARLLTRGVTRRFQHGYWHLEPMVAALNGSVVTLLCVYAFFNAVRGLADGGRALAFDVSLAYAAVVAAICFAMYAYQSRANRRVGSAFLRIDAQGWLMAGVISSALLGGFALGFLLQPTPLAPLTPYIDPVLLMGLTLGFLPVQLGIVRGAMREVLLIAPEDVDAQVRRAVEAVMDREGLIRYESHVARVGRRYFIEVLILTTPDFARGGGVAALDALRAEIFRGLSVPLEQSWFTVEFTASETWT